MSYILSLDTSTRGCSVAIHQDDKLLMVSELFHEKSSSEMLTTLIANVVKSVKLTFEDIDAVAVAKGPGSYTGLRIGVSTAKGLCYTLEKPLIAINTLEAMAMQIKDLGITEGLLCPMLDARRMEVYCALYDTKTGQEFSPTEAKVIDNESFINVLATNSVLFFGDGAEKCKSILGTNTNAKFTEKEIYPSARTIGVLAYKKFVAQEFEDVSDFEPFYLKEFFATTPKKLIATA